MHIVREIVFAQVMIVTYIYICFCEPKQRNAIYKDKKNIKYQKVNIYF